MRVATPFEASTREAAIMGRAHLKRLRDRATNHPARDRATRETRDKAHLKHPQGKAGNPRVKATIRAKAIKVDSKGTRVRGKGTAKAKTIKVAIKEMDKTRATVEITTKGRVKATKGTVKEREILAGTKAAIKVTGRARVRASSRLKL